MQRTRRHFLAGLGTALAGTWSEPLHAATENPAKVEVLGHGAHRYVADKLWATPTQGRHHPIMNCHEMVQVRDGRLFMIGDHPQNQMLVFREDGGILESWGCQWPGGHGLTRSDENGEEFLWVADSGMWKTGGANYRQTGRVTKIDLTGREIFSISHPMTVGAYPPDLFFNPTETAVAPNGDLYIADGYGSQFILRYDAQGRFLQKFGGKDAEGPERLLNAHGVAVDKRRGDDQATLLVTSRSEQCFKRFTLDGRYMETLPVPGALVCRPVISGQELYAGVCWSKTPLVSSLPQNPSGFVVVLDADGRVISAPGGSEPKYDQDKKLQPLQQESRVIDHGHDVCVLDSGDLIVCQWNANQTFPVRFRRVME